MDLRRLMCTTIYSTAFSPCGRYVAAADNFGFISVFDFDNALSLNTRKWQKSIFSFKAHDGPIHSVVSTKDTLISGGEGPIAAWKWNDILEKKPAKAWILDEPSQGAEGSFTSNDINILLCDGKKLYSGRDDNLVCMWDIETRKCEQKLLGHTEYVHDIAVVGSTNSIASASEDGSVKVWDLRSAQVTSSFQPHLSSELSRPQCGKWISCVSVDEYGQWMVCGGGPKLSLWHLRSQSQAAILDCPDFTPYTVKFHSDVIVSGGNGNTLHHWYTNGKEKASIPCSIGMVFSLTFNHKRKSNNPMLVCGTGHKMDVFCNLSYRSHTINL